MNLKENICLEKWKNFLDLKVIPNSPETKFVEVMENGVFKLRAKGIPERWKVNQEIIKYLSKALKIDKKDIEIINGKTSSLKKIKIFV